MFHSEPNPARAALGSRRSGDLNAVGCQLLGQPPSDTDGTKRPSIHVYAAPDPGLGAAVNEEEIGR